MTKGLLVQSGEGEAATKTHRRLDKEQALVFVRLHEFWAKQLDPRLQQEADREREAVVAAKETVAAASDDADKEAARKRLDKAIVAATRASRGVEREAERKAQARVTGAIHRVLMEDWSYRHLDVFYKSCTELAGPRAAAQTGGAIQPAGTNLPEPLFAEEGACLVIHRNRLASAGAEEKARLANVLRGLLEELVGARTNVNVDAA